MVYLEPRLKKEGKFAIGTVVGLSYAKSGVWVEFHFSYRGKKYRGKDAVPNRTREKDLVGQYLVRFLPQYPSISMFYNDCPVKNLDQPYDGWEKPPIKCKDAEKNLNASACMLLR